MYEMMQDLTGQLDSGGVNVYMTVTFKGSLAALQVSWLGVDSNATSSMALFPPHSQKCPTSHATTKAKHQCNDWRAMSSTAVAVDDLPWCKSVKYLLCL